MFRKLLILFFAQALVAAAPSNKIEQRDALQIELLKLSNALMNIESKLESLTSNQLAKNPTIGTSELPSSCAGQATGLNTIFVPFVGHEPFRVACNGDTWGGNWTVIQRRVNDHVNFYRDWAQYKRGFGHFKGSFFIGLDNLYVMTANEPQELLIVMEDFDGARRFAKYDGFAIGDESEKYALKALGTYSGDAGDELSALIAQKFTTYDQDNDQDYENCAKVFYGAWWYKHCSYSNLNGLYLAGEVPEDDDGRGIEWHGFRGHNYSLKFVEMLIRPKAH